MLGLVDVFFLDVAAVGENLVLEALLVEVLRVVALPVEALALLCLVVLLSPGLFAWRGEKSVAVDLLPCKTRVLQMNTLPATRHFET